MKPSGLKRGLALRIFISRRICRKSSFLAAGEMHSITSVILFSSLILIVKLLIKLAISNLNLR